MCNVDKVKVKRVFNVGDSQTDTNNFWQYSLYLTGQKTDVNASISALYPGFIDWIPGTLFSMGGLTPLPAQPYWNGRFSNGPVGSELIASSLKLSSDAFINYAHGGSPTIDYLEYLSSYWSADTSEAPELATVINVFNSIINGKWLHISLARQARVLLENYHFLNPSDIIVFSGGANDYLNEYWNPELIVQTQVQIIRSLLDHGVGILVWGTLPDITRTPCLMEAENKQSMRRVVRRHNQLVDDALEELRESYPQQLVLFVDNAALFESLLIEALHKGMNIKSNCTSISFVGCFDKNSTDIRKSAHVQPCNNPEDFFFWDSVHPSSRVNTWMNAIACHLLSLLNIDVQCESKSDIDVNVVFERAKSITQSKMAIQQMDLLLKGECPAPFSR